MSKTCCNEESVKRRWLKYAIRWFDGSVTFEFIGNLVEVSGLSVDARVSGEMQELVGVRAH